VKPIVPKGYNIDEYPKALDSSQLAVREASVTLNKSAESVTETRTVIESHIATYSSFFVAHFGLKVLEGITAMYFPQGHTVKQGGGTGNTLSIAQEIMSYQNPSPADHELKIEVLVAILNAILRIPAQQADDAGLRQKRLEYVEEAVFKLQTRPTRDSMVAATQLPGPWKPKLSNYTRTSYFKLGINSSDGKYGYVRGPKIGNKAPVWMERPHSAGFNIIVEEVINHYEEVYQIHSSTTTPRHFWEANSKKRLGVEIDSVFGKDNYTVKVFDVDPATGAPRNTGRAVARAPITNYQGNPGFLLAKVKQNLFPEVYLLSDGVAMHEGGRENHYKDQLINAKNMWEGIPDKAKTPIACVIEQTFSYVNVQGVDRPTTPSKNTTIPINAMRIYLQPTGIEEAMKRILDVSHPAGNAIEKWAVTDLFQGEAVDPETDSQSTGSRQYKYKKQLTIQGWTEKQSRYTRVLQLVYALLDNPHICSDGLVALNRAASNPSTQTKQDLFGAYHWMTYLPQNYYSQYMNDAVKIFNYAGWPQAAPQQIFAAPVDEEQDLNMLLNMFKNYMNEQVNAPPNTMHAPESFNGRLDSLGYTSQDGSSNYYFEMRKVVPSSLGPHAYKKSAETMVRVSGAQQPTIRKKQRYHKGATTVVTGTPVVGTSPFPMPPPIKPSQGANMGYKTSASQLETATYVAGGGLVIALGIAAIHMARK